MPLHINLPADDTRIELEEYVELIESRGYDFSNLDDLIDSAVYLQQLNNNKELLVNKIAGELADIDAFQRSNLYGPKVFILRSHPKFFLRVVVWEPISDLERSIKGFNYDICHDHNFHILTAGYFGPGYKTRTYTYNYQNVTGYLGEKVSMDNESIYELPQGKLLLYRAKHDIHIQLPPEKLSISLNLIPNNDSVKLPQYQFDESSRTICRYLQNSGNELMVRMAGALGDTSLVDLLDAIFGKTDNVHLKALSASSMIQLDPDIRDVIEHRVWESGNKLLIDLFNRETKKAGASLGVFEAVD
jgi:hypothetical protein